MITEKRIFEFLKKVQRRDCNIRWVQKHCIQLILQKKKNKKFCLDVHYSKESSYLFLNCTKIIKFKSKDPEILPHPLCLGNISKDWSVDNMKKTGLNRYLYDFCVDYDAIAVDDILDIHKYLMKKYNMILKCLALLKKHFLRD